MAGSLEASPAGELLTQLESRGVRVWSEAQRLKFDAPRGAMDNELLGRLRAHKEELLTLLQQKGTLPEKPFALTRMQEAYWVGENGSLPLSTPARYYFELELRGNLTNNLGKALAVLSRRHELLRATINDSGELGIHPEPREFTPVIHSPGEHESAAGRDQIRERMLSRPRPSGSWPPFHLEVSRSEGNTYFHFDLALWVFDGVSLRSFIQELRALLQDPETTQLPPLPSYGEYVRSRDVGRNGRKRSRNWKHWESRLHRFPSAPPLPLAQAEHEIEAPSFSRQLFKIEPSGVQALTEFARAAHISNSFALLTAYAEVLQRFSGSKHFALTVLHSDRPVQAQTEPTVLGNFSRVVLLEVDWTEHSSFAERARRLKAQFWGDVESRVSGIDVSRELSRRRNTRGGTAYPITFTLVPSLLDVSPDGDAVAQIDHNRSHLQVPQVHLDHQVCEDPDGGLTFNWDVVDGLFPEGLIEKMFEAYRRRVVALSEDSSLWDAEGLARLCPGPPPQASRPARRPELLHEPFLRQATLHPEYFAVLTPERKVRYGELREMAKGLAVQLKAKGVAPGNLVGVTAEKGWEQIVAVLGILFAGAAYVPIDPTLPSSRRTLLAEQANVTTIVTQASLGKKLDWPSHVTRLAVDAEALLHESSNHPEAEGDFVQQHDTDLAYVIFTSGTTGTPKGVMIEHGSASNTIDDINSRLALDFRDRVFGISSLSFDLSVYDIFGTLAAGAALVLPGPSETKEPSRWRELVDSYGVTVWNSVPAIASLLEENARLTGRGLGPLRAVLMSGDWIPLSLPPALQRISPKLRLISLGGATEASIWSNIYEIDQLAPDWSSVPYGRALKHQSMHVLDDALDLAHPLVPGSIYIGGIGLARGYLGDEGRTKEAFIKHPVTGERLYRTGDLGRYRLDGEIELLGREDHQVKIRGYRIECSEIEAALVSTGDIGGAAVVAWGEGANDKRLVAYVTPSVAGLRLNEEQLSAKLTQILPEYMVPSSITQLDSLPLTVNGKVDRSRLPPPEGNHAPSRTEAREPRNAVERQLLSLWTEVLDIDGIGIDTDFFEAGGSSLAGMRLLVRVEATFGSRLPLSTLIQGPTIAQLAGQLQRTNQTRGSSSLVKLRDGAREKTLTCIHPVGGSVACYLELSRFMPPGVRTLGIQAPEQRRNSRPADIESIARAYLAELDAEGAEPHRLCGWSFGGVVAYEMGRQLMEQGKRVDLVAMIDTPFAQETDHRGHSEPELMLQFLNDILAIAGHKERLKDDAFETCSPGEPAERALELLARRNVDAFGSSQLLHNAFETFTVNMRALQAYSPPPYTGALMHFRASESRAGRNIKDGWSRVAPQLQSQLLPADHYTIVTGKPLVRIAQALAERLA